MTLKDKLTSLQQAFTALKTKIKNKLESQQKTLTQTQTKLNESNHKLELVSKENSENEKVLDTLLKEFEELGRELEG
jgi:predicted nuclease with TOPRIM domain